jgi:Flp pilus assembly protein CpaB
MILVAAILIGIVAAFGLYQYIQKVEEDATPNPVSAYVLKADIPRGTPFAEAQAAIERKTISAEIRPANFVADLKELENKVAITDLAANQVLVDNLFVSADVATTSSRDRLGENMVAVALPIDGVRAVGGLLQPGDEVNIMVAPQGVSELTLPPAPDGAVSASELATPYSKAARYLYQKVRILSIGTSVRPVAGEPVAEADGTETAQQTENTGTIVFEVPAAAAQRLVAIDPSLIYLTLIPKTWTPQPVPAIPGAELGVGATLPGEDPNQLTPYGPAGYTAKPGN